MPSRRPTHLIYCCYILVGGWIFEESKQHQLKAGRMLPIATAAVSTWLGAWFVATSRSISDTMSKATKVIKSCVSDTNSEQLANAP